MIKYSETLVLWDFKTGRIALHRLMEDNYEYFKGLRYSSGASWIEVRSMVGSALTTRMLLDMWSLVLNYDLDVKDVHRAFCHVEEYLPMVSDVMPEDLRQLGKDEAVLITPGEPPVYFKLDSGRKELVQP